MLVPVQYQRLMALAGLRPLRPVALPHEVLHQRAVRRGAQGRRARALAGRPGRVLRHDRRRRHLHPATRTSIPTSCTPSASPAPGHDIRLIDEDGREVAAGEIGEVVGHSPRDDDRLPQPARRRPREAEWFDAAGKRFIRTGDVGRFDADGFLTLMDRKKDMIISGGFNIYPERSRGGAARASGRRRGGRGRRAVRALGRDAGRLRRAARRRATSTPRTCAPGPTRGSARPSGWPACELVDELPRSAIGKVLKRELRDRFGQAD